MGQLTRCERRGGRARLRLAIVVAVVAACSSATPSPSPAIDPGATAPPGGTATGGPSPSTSTEPAPPTSEALIAGALERGEIDYPTSLLYRVYAAFNAAELPAEYRSQVIDTHAATFAFKDVEEHSAELSPDIVAALTPYLARPNEAESIFSRPGATAQVGASTPPTPLKPVDKWVSKPAGGGKARVWTADSELADALLDLYAGEVDRVWPKVFSLTREPIPDEAGEPLASVNPDQAIDLYFVDLGIIDPRVWACHTDPASPDCTSALTARGGYTRDAKPRNGRTSSSYVVIDSAAKGPLLDANIAHELTHTSQNTYDRFEAPWLLDSTATWSEYRTLQLLGLKPQPEYEYLGEFFAGLDEPLVRDAGLNRYGSWLYFHSLQIDHGDQILPRVFEKMSADGEQNAGAVDEAFAFQDNFGDFAVGNWNRDTADRYRKDTQFPSDRQAAPDYRATMNLGDDQLEFETKPLSADYASYSFADEVRKVIVDNPFTAAVAACNCIPEVWLLPKVKGKWQPPQQLTAAQREFCFDRPDQDLDELVVIVANPGWQGSNPLSTAMMPTVRALDEGCACDDRASSWSGTLKFAYEKSGGAAVVHRSADISLTFDEVYLDDEYAKSWIGEFTGGSAEERDLRHYADHTDSVTGGPITIARGSLILDKQTCLFNFNFRITVMSTFVEFDNTFESETTIGDVGLWNVAGSDAGISVDRQVPAHVLGGEAGEDLFHLVSGGQISGGYEFELLNAVGEEGLGTASVQVNLTPTYPPGE